MKRNWDTIRGILSQLEKYNDEDGVFSLSHFPPNKHKEISYHMDLLIEAGLVNGEMSNERGVEHQDFFVSRLTWKGHEFLDSIRDDTVWQKTKKSFVSKGITMTFDLIKSVASDIAASYFKSAFGG